MYSALLDRQQHTTFPNVFKLVQIALTFALTCLTSVSPERVFSELRLLKTYLRSTMTQTRLASLLIINVKDININIDKVIDAAQSGPRRIELLLDPG